MIRFLEILNYLGINTLEDADNYVESLFSELDLIRSGEDISSHSFINFEKTGENEYTGKIPLIDNSSILQRDVASGLDLNILSTDSNSPLAERNTITNILKDFLRFEDEVGIIYSIREKEEAIKSVYAELNAITLDASNKVILLPNKSDYLENRIASCNGMFGRFQIEDLKIVEKAKRAASRFDNLEVIEPENFTTFKIYKYKESSESMLGYDINSPIYERVVKLKVIFFDGPNDYEFTQIKRALNPYHRERLLNFELYEEIAKNNPDISFDLDSILSRIGFSSIEELNNAVNSVSELRAPNSSASDPKGKFPDINSPTNILFKTFGGTENDGALRFPPNIFEYPLGINEGLYSGMQKIDGMLKVKVSEDNYLFEIEGEHKEYLAEDIAGLSLEPRNNLTNDVPRIYKSRLYEIVRSSEKIQEESISFAKKYISLFEELFSKRCDKAISEEFPFYKNIFKDNKILTSEIDKLKTLDDKNKYDYEKDILNEERSVLGISTLKSEIFDDKYMEVLQYESQFKKELSYFIATYKYAKYIVSSNDIYRTGLFGISIGLGGNNSRLEYIVENVKNSDFCNKIKKEVELILDNSENKYFDLDNIIEEAVYSNVSDENDKIISAVSENLNLTLNSIKNDYFISIFNCGYNFSTSDSYYSKEKTFAPGHSAFEESVRYSKTVLLDINSFERINLSDNEESAVGISNDFMIDSVSGISSAIFKNYLIAAENEIDKLKLEYILNRKKTFSVSGYRNISKGVFKRKNYIGGTIDTEKNINLFIEFVISKNKIKDEIYNKEFDLKSDKAKSIASRAIKGLKSNITEIGISAVQYLESKIEGFDYTKDESFVASEEIKKDKDLTDFLSNIRQVLAQKINFLDSEIDSIFNLELRDVVYMFKDMEIDMYGTIEGPGVKIPELSFDGGKFSVVPSEMIDKIKHIKSKDPSFRTLQLSKENFSKDINLIPISSSLDNMNLSSIIFAADHCRDEVGTYGKNNLKSFIKIYEEIIKDIMISEEKFIASKQIKSIFDFIKDEKLKEFIDFILKKDNSSFSSLKDGNSRGVPVASSKVYKYVNKVLSDIILCPALLFSKKHKFETKSDFIDNLLSVFKASSFSSRNEDFAFMVFCCNHMFESELSLPKKISIAESVIEIFHSDLNSEEVDFSSSGICNFALKNKEFINKNKDENKGQDFFNLLKNIEFMQSKKFIDNSDKAIFISLVKAFYKLRSSFLFFRYESLEENIIEFSKQLFLMLKDGAATESIIKDSLFFDCEKSDFEKAMIEINKDYSNFEEIIKIMNVDKFRNLDTFINSCGYSEETAFDQNESIYLIIRSIDYICEIVSKTSSYLKYFKIAEKKNEKLFEADYNFLYKGMPFGFYTLRDLDPYHFQVGRDTNCCQVLGGVGSAAAVDSFVNGQAGVLVLHSGKTFNSDNILTQSYFHIVENEKYENSFFILDNIEYSRKNCLKIEVLLGEKFDDSAQIMFAALAKHLSSKGFGDTLVGKRYTKISIEKFENSRLEEDPRVFTTTYKDFDFNDHKNLSKFLSAINGISKAVSNTESDIDEQNFDDNEYTENQDEALSKIFDLSELDMTGISYSDYSRSKGILKKIFSELIDKKSERFRQLKDFCSKNGLNFQKIKKIKIDFCKKTIKDIEEKESINKIMDDKILYLKKYLKSKAYSNITIDDLSVCLEKYNENENNLPYVEENIKSTDKYIDTRINVDTGMSSRGTEILFDDLSRYKSQYYITSKTNILLKYAILGSKNIIKREFSNYSNKKNETIDYIKNDLNEIGIINLQNLSLRYTPMRKLFDQDKLIARKNLKSMRDSSSNFKNSYPILFSIAESSFVNGIKFLDEDTINIDELKYELKSFFSEEENNTDLHPIIKNFGPAICYYIFKKLGSEFLDQESFRLFKERLIFSEKFDSVDSLLDKIAEVSTIGQKQKKLEKLNDFVILNEDLDLEELLKSAKVKDNYKILKLAKWLVLNKFSKEFEELNKLNWEA